MLYSAPRALREPDCKACSPERRFSDGADHGLEGLCAGCEYPRVDGPTHHEDPPARHRVAEPHMSVRALRGRLREANEKSSATLNILCLSPQVGDTFSVSHMPCLNVNSDALTSLKYSTMRAMGTSPRRSMASSISNPGAASTASSSILRTRDAPGRARGPLHAGLERCRPLLSAPSMAEQTDQHCADGPIT